MRIIYIGTVDFSYHCLSEVLKNNGNVTGIVTLKKALDNSDYKDISPLARQNDIPIFHCNNVNDGDVLKWVRDIGPDIIFCWGLSQLIKSELLSIPPMGIVGVHPALLPQNRGRHPIIWTLFLGLRESGLTFFFMDENADAGPILSQRKFKISEDDDSNTLYAKIKNLASIQIAEFLPELVSGTYKKIIQNHEEANYWRKRDARDGIIDWRMNSTAILNLIRALNRPYPGAKINYRGKEITVWKAIKYSSGVSVNMEPGKILEVSEGRPAIKCYDSTIILTEFEPEINFIKGEYLT